MLQKIPPLAAVILAAGQGSRMKSNQAKVLFEVGGEPMIAWSIRLAETVGAEPVVTVVGHEAEAVKQHVTSRFGSFVTFVHQSERLGTGHAARIGMSALSDFEGTVLILYGDVPLLEGQSLRKLAALVDRHECPVAVISTHLQQPTGYGRIIRDASLNVLRIVEHKDATDEERAITEVNAGIYAVDAAFLREALGQLSNDNAQGEYYLTDIVASALQRGLRVAGLAVAPEEVQGANDRRQLAQLEAIARHRIIDRHMSHGVTFIAPEHSYVGAEVHIDPDCIIYPGVHLRGKTRLGSKVTVDTGSVLIDSEVSEGTTIYPYSMLEKAKVGAYCSVGPFARLRPQTELQETVRVGNFVEVKNTSVASGSKIPHLSYIGDATVGSKTNIGAGTITCNYDGAGKYKTTIEANTFVGSNSTLIAPLHVGSHSYVAAGSVINADVPPGTLAIGRSRQTNKADRAITIREQALARKAQKTEE